MKLNPITTRLGVLVLAGPNARKVLQKLTTTDLSNEAFPWLSGQAISVGHTSCHALRVNFVGELGFEFHHPIEQQVALFDLLMEAGKRIRHQALWHQGHVVVLNRKELPPGAARTFH